MPFNWRAWPLFSAALLLLVSGFVPQNAVAQVSGPDFNGDPGFRADSQPLLGVQKDIPFNLYQINATNSFNLDVPKFDPIVSGRFEDSYPQLVNLAEHVDKRDHSSTPASASLPVASASSQVLPELFADPNSPAVSNSAFPPPSPPDPSDQGWHYSVSPYLWLPGLHGTIGALGQEASVGASFRDLFSNFSFALMGAFDPRYNRIVMPFDFMWIRLTNDKALPFNILATSAKIKVNLDVLTQKIGYRVVDTERFKVDALAGVRYWHVGNTLDLESSVLTTTNFYGSADWVDAVGGARIQATLTPKLVLTIAGDAGGGGANSDYQVGGLIGWKLKKIILQAGYRYLTVDYRPGSTVCDIVVSGIILGATIPLK
jgi:hypothetical protein